MLAIGNDQLGEIIEECKCRACGETHKIKYGKSKNDAGEWEETKMLGFYSCGGKTYLASIDRREIK